MRVIIAGGRKFDNYTLLREECLQIFRQLKLEGYDTKRDKITIVSGKANGADTLGERFSIEFGLGLKEFPADWSNLDVEKCIVKTNRYGKYNALAGNNRNLEMAEYAKDDLELGVLIAFHDGKSTGTKDMINLANKHGLRVFVVGY